MLYITTWNKGQTGKLNSVGAQNVLIITKREITRNNLKKEEKRKEKKNLIVTLPNHRRQDTKGVGWGGGLKRRSKTPDRSVEFDYQQIYATKLPYI